MLREIIMNTLIILLGGATLGFLMWLIGVGVGLLPTLAEMLR